MLALVAAPQKDDKLEIREVAEATPGRQEALIEVKAISLNRGELSRLATAQDGWRPGWDVAGVVLKQAADGSGPAAGTRVVGLVPGGGWAQRVAVPTPQLAVLPDPVSFDVAATLPVAGVTALRILRLGGLLLGKRVCITGGAGGVGRFAIQLAARAGAHVTALVGRAERGQGLRELGADEVVAGSFPDGPFDLILESAGGASLGAALSRVAPNGTLATFGNSSREPTTFQVLDFYLKGGTRVYGFFLFHEAARDPVASDLAYLLSLVAAGWLQSQVALETDWREPAAALAALRERRLPGKAVLHLR